MKKLLLIAVGACLALASNSQITFYNITGKILDGNKSPIEFATVALLSQNDSSLVKGEISDESGAFDVEHIQKGNYFIAISYVGFQKYFSPVSLEHSLNLGSINLTKDATELDEAVVQASKPLIEHNNEKLVLNVESTSLSSAGNALDVLQRAPGVVVDNDGNIRLKGKQEVLVMIDGKETHLTQEQLTTQLRNMSADQISKVELITNPGANYDATGSAGIINIVTKKNKKQGFNGGTSAGVSKGDYWGTNESLNLNCRTKKVNLFGNYSFQRGDRGQTLDIHRNITFNDVLSKIGEKSSLEHQSNNSSVKAGADFFINEKQTIGFVASGFLDPEKDYNNTFASFTNASNDLQSSSSNSGVNNGHYKNISFNLNYDGKFDTLGRELKVDADYSYYDNSADANYTTHFFDASGIESGSPYIEYDFNPTTVDIKSIKLDYTQPLKKIGTLDFGMKSSYVVTDNDIQVNTLVNDEMIPDVLRSNHFKYTENINAGYISFSHQWKKIGLQAGLRGEQTVADGNSVSLNNTFRRNYIQLFPSVSLNDEINDKNSLSISYGRRIDRPAYSQLDPFVYYLDQYLYEQGNPNLQPQLTHAISLTYMYKQSYSITVDYALTTNNLIELFYQVDSTNTTFVTPGNFESMQFYDVTVYAPFTIAKWWNVTPVVTAYYIDQNTNYLGEKFRNNKLSFTANIQNSFQFPKGFSADVSAMYQSPGIWSVATFTGFNEITAGVTKQLMKGKARVKLSMSDIFLSNYIFGSIQYANLDGTFLQHNDTRQANVTFTYNFGKQQQSRDHRSSDEEEKSRVKTGR